jgi:hypothetical protein
MTLTKTTKLISPSTPTNLSPSDKNFNKLKNRKKFGKAGQRRNTNRLGINTFLNTSPSLSLSPSLCSELSSPHYTRQDHIITPDTDAGVLATALTRDTSLSLAVERGSVKVVDRAS